MTEKQDSSEVDTSVKEKAYRARARLNYLQKLSDITGQVFGVDVHNLSYQDVKTRNRSREDRVRKNREAAVRSRKRKEVYINALELKVEELSKSNIDLRMKVDNLEGQVKELWQLLRSKDELGEAHQDLVDTLRRTNFQNQLHDKPDEHNLYSKVRKAVCFDSELRQRRLQSAFNDFVETTIPHSGKFFLVEDVSGLMVENLVKWHQRRSAFVEGWVRNVIEAFDLTPEQCRSSEFFCYQMKGLKPQLMRAISDLSEAKDRLLGIAQRMSFLTKQFMEVIPCKQRAAFFLAVEQNGFRKELTLLEIWKQSQLSREDLFVEAVLKQ